MLVPDPPGPVRVRRAAGPADMAAVAALFRAYAEWLDEDISFQGFAAELEGLPGKYAPPSGALLLAWDAWDDRVLGCVAMRPIQLGAGYVGRRDPRARVCEMKRLFVAPGARGRRLATALVREVLALARAAAYDEIVLDTLARMQPAVRLYEAHGFTRTEPYYWNPLPDVVYFTRRLREVSPTA